MIQKQSNVMDSQIVYIQFGVRDNKRVGDVDGKEYGSGRWVQS